MLWKRQSRKQKMLISQIKPLGWHLRMHSLPFTMFTETINSFTNANIDYSISYYIWHCLIPILQIFPGSYQRIDVADVILKLDENSLLGSGGYCSVYKGQYKGLDAAFKVWENIRRGGLPKG